MELRVPQGDADVIQQPWKGSKFKNGILQHAEVLKFRAHIFYQGFLTFLQMGTILLTVFCQSVLKSVGSDQKIGKIKVKLINHVLMTYFRSKSLSFCCGLNWET